MSAPAALPSEYAMRPVPERLELCGRCRGGLVYRRGPEGVAYCARCGAEGTSAAGPVYVLAPSDGIA